MPGGLVQSMPLDALPASAAVDTLHLAAGLKAAFRSRLVVSHLFAEVERWCRCYGLALRADHEDFICVARTDDLARRVLEVDRSTEPHERTLGLLLGYPSCCCEFVGRVGEANIDRLAEEIRGWEFTEDYRMTDPWGYLEGCSLICHLPCSPRCASSLAVARGALHFLKQHCQEPGFQRWSKWLGAEPDAA